MLIYRFGDGEFTFWEAHLTTAILVYRVRTDSNPATRAMVKGIPRGTTLCPAKQAHITQWLIEHPDFPLLDTYKENGECQT